MSESTSTPTAPAAPAPAADSPGGAAPATGQPGLSVSEAGRLLNQRRRETQQQAMAPPATQPGQTASPPGQPAAPEAPAESTPPDAGLDSLRAALGVPEAVPAAPAVADTASIEVDGRRLTTEEVRRALAHQRDYTMKTTQLAEQARALAEQQQALATVLPLLQPELARIQAQVTELPPPDAALIDTDPQAYLRALAAYHASQQDAGRLGQLTQVQQQAQARALAQQVERGNAELAREYPQWADPTTRGQWQSRIREWAMSKGGFNEREIASLGDHRQVRVLMKAMMFDHMSNGATTQAPVRAAPVRGQTPPPAPAAAITAADQAFEARPSVRNATALLTARRQGQR